jgi:hypothetical protein
LRKEVGKMEMKEVGKMVEENGSDKIQLWYSPYGSHGQYVRQIAVLKDGTVVDPSKIGISSKRHKYVIVKRSDVIAIIEDNATSSGWKGFKVKEGDGKIVVEAELKKWIEGNKEFTQQLEHYYYVTQSMKVHLTTVSGPKSYKLVGKPKVRVIQLENGSYGITGETFEIKDKLKAMGAKWNPDKKCWVFTQVPPQLDEIAEVIK